VEKHPALFENESDRKELNFMLMKIGIAGLKKYILVKVKFELKITCMIKSN
jgi:hypothetical protein